MSNLKIIKGTVFLMSFLLIAGLITFVFLISQKIKHFSSAPVSEASLKLSADEKIDKLVANDEFLFLLIKNQETQDRILVINPRENKITSTINLN
ncbi:MAG: hypothetical protein PHE89_05920 [Alphaproteobacteria bacterium]|nr:hypothetical protein [Alphaproteobacteria bacterium]